MRPRKGRGQPVALIVASRYNKEPPKFYVDFRSPTGSTRAFRALLKNGDGLPAYPDVVRMWPILPPGGHTDHTHSAQSGVQQRRRGDHAEWGDPTGYEHDH
jgi:hypothetical protein